MRAILLLAARGCYSFIHSSLSLFLNASMKAPPWSACATKISIHSWTRRAFGHLPNHVPTQGKSSGRAVSWWFGAAFSGRGNNPPFLHPWTLTFSGPAIGRCGLFEGMATCSNVCVSWQEFGALQALVCPLLIAWMRTLSGSLQDLRPSASWANCPFVSDCWWLASNWSSTRIMSVWFTSRVLEFWMAKTPFSRNTVPQTKDWEIAHCKIRTTRWHEQCGRQPKKKEWNVWDVTNSSKRHLRTTKMKNQVSFKKYPAMFLQGKVSHALENCNLERMNSYTSRDRTRDPRVLTTAQLGNRKY